MESDDDRANDHAELAEHQARESQDAYYRALEAEVFAAEHELPLATPADERVPYGGFHQGDRAGDSVAPALCPYMKRGTGKQSRQWKVCNRSMRDPCNDCAPGGPGQGYSDRMPPGFKDGSGGFSLLPPITPTGVEHLGARA